MDFVYKGKPQFLWSWLPEKALPHSTAKLKELRRDATIAPS